MLWKTLPDQSPLRTSLMAHTNPRWHRSRVSLGNPRGLTTTIWVGPSASSWPRKELLGSTPEPLPTVPAA